MMRVTGGLEFDLDEGPLDAARGITLAAMMSSALWAGLAITVLTVW
ncbi:hypothetical protein [Roseicella aerolata]|uniref:Uncharacterized protein n=1 Tax=Roseicella aerolata TaxID=2883479 RepID=A0A9X1IIN5_9PROT|nr:hypothetical protein [Roseicella aerolata]MCB4824083.1 hypothetical protein [Roseicella aerolata]